MQGKSVDQPEPEISRSRPVAILDFGSQYTMLIARRVRALRVYCEIMPPDVPAATLRDRGTTAIVLSGGPGSVYEEGAPRYDPGILDLGLPILGICYGMQLLARDLGAKVTPGRAGEYGSAEAEFLGESPLFRSLGNRQRVWMSHGDTVSDLPPGVGATARSETVPVVAFESAERRFYGVQFHPEVSHTPRGREILKHFMFDICRCPADWRMSSFVGEAVQSIRDRVGEDRVLCAVSGGVDSTVTAVLVHRAIGDRLTPLMVDTGFLRTEEAVETKRVLAEDLGIKLELCEAAPLFLSRIEGVIDPEEKRRRIGHAFIEVFETEARNRGSHAYLAQGTLYPDVIESVSYRGPSATIKTHHNVGGLPERMGMLLLEPLRELFKDEVRELARELGISPRLYGRHPFPGPGLAVRVVGEVTEEALEQVRRADRIFEDELRAAAQYEEVAQAFAVLLPVRTVGVMGDRRTYERVIVLRAITTEDFMTADWAHLPPELLARVSNRIVNEVPGVNRVVYDVSSKPPSTVEWE